MQRLLVAYAIATWIYRFVLFLGIAALVYHMFFKVLGVLLFAVEMWWFIARPIVRELLEWCEAAPRQALNVRTVITFTVAGAILVALLFPWRTSPSMRPPSSLPRRGCRCSRRFQAGWGRCW